MQNLLDSASGVIASSARRIEVAAQNIANISTSGYKRHIAFSSLLTTPIQPPTGMRATPDPIRDALPRMEVASDLRAGAFVQTGNPLDVAISGDGFFAVRTPDGIGYTRQGHFKRNDADQLVTPQGWIVQAQGGGDVTLRGTSLRIEPDGTILEDERPTARIAIVDFESRTALVRGDAGLLRAGNQTAIDVTAPIVKVGTIEASNVSSGDDMVKIMEALRIAEMGQRFAQTYDDLLNRAITTFGQASA